MKHIKMKYGFTLIELLVVVIIIAVLSAVALPMYKHAALKSRFSKVMPVAKSIVEAQEVYYLGKNIYAANDEKDLLDVAPSGDTTIELATRDQENQYNYVAASSSEVPGARYIMYQKHSPRFANTIQCEADTADEQALWLCEKGLNGQEIPGGSINTTQGKTYKTFLLEGDRGDDTFIPPCPEGATCNSDTGDVTGCTDEYYMKDGICVERTVYNQNGSSCIASLSGQCEGAIFTGARTTCQTQKVYGCANTLFSGDYSVCDGRGSKSCYGAIIQAGGLCNAYTTDACKGTLYGANPNKDPNLIGCCNSSGGYCPEGTPKCKKKGGLVQDTTNGVYVTDGWWGGYCNPASMVNGVCPAGSPKQGGGTWQACEDDPTKTC